jgi:N-acetylglutamate synthase-like GNAT family acetyltransferase
MDQSGHVLGVACATPGDEFCHLLFVAVRPEARGQGTGSMIINHVLSHYAGSCDVMYLLTEDASFFERFGFGRIEFELLPEEILQRVDRAARKPDNVAMEIVLPGHWTRK